jgi:hypothetical protein
MANNIVFDAAQAEVAYRSEQLYATRRNLRIKRLGRRIARARTAATARAAEPVPACERPQSGPAEKSREKVSAR